MPKLQRLNLNITAELARQMDDVVESGEYKNRTDFITTAIKELLEYHRLKAKGYQTFTLPAPHQSESEGKNSS